MSNTVKTRAPIKKQESFLSRSLSVTDPLVTELERAVTSTEKKEGFMDLARSLISPKLKATQKEKKAIAQNITRKFLAAKLRNSHYGEKKFGLKEYSKARALLKLAIDPKHFSNPNLYFGNINFKDALSIMIVKIWQLNRENLVPYNMLILSAVSPCTKKWLNEGITETLKRISRLEVNDTDESKYQKFRNWLTTYKNDEDLSVKPEFTLPSIKFYDFRSFAELLAFGFINTNKDWFTYKRGRASGINLEENKGRFLGYCGINKDEIEDELSRFYP